MILNSICELLGKTNFELLCLCQIFGYVLSMKYLDKTVNVYYCKLAAKYPISVFSYIRPFNR